MASIELKNIQKAYDHHKIVIDNLNLTIPDGSFTVLIGPSGCGKTTTLRLIAGLETATKGEVYIDGKLMNDVEPGQRDIAMVFQNYALYPTMTVKENIEFGLINTKVPKAERTALINEITEIVGLKEHLKKKPGQLSGGQRQRVALARAMVKKPKVFLMDEPLSNLDAKLRSQMRVELSELHKRLNTTFIYVTHDQVEAMSMATNIILMNDGKVQQEDAPKEIYGNPNNVFTAQFIGSPSMNMYEIESLTSFKPRHANASYIGFRSSAGELDDFGDSDQTTEHDLCFTTRIITRELLGSEIIYNTEAYFGKIYIKTHQQEEIPLDTEIQIRVRDKNLYYFDQNQARVHDVKRETVNQKVSD
ncbi:ABC transporter ATP-binding protein [Fundicoccus ignavus]|uniref:ATP-binding cassette domain-containing protein n=1 Tax=Fundicoccus ignavus TaxID=2664442 RepID=A0A844CBI7_9LACT|nr:ABC transporter ATP-binding protein [Fundicoccus ignavus]MRJ46851.1 ATP-binding cassette domain-containing protein [Fundicoccus ignavus]